MRCGVAAITIETSGGGVAAVTRLIWRVLRERWPAAWLITLDDGSPATGEVRTADTLARLNFGARLARPQLFGDCDWVMYTHLSAALVQSYLPRPGRRPYAIFLHGIEAWRPLDRRRRRALEHATVLLANSDYTARRVAEAHPWVGPISVCPLSLPEERTHRAENVPTAGVRTNDVLIVGRLSSEERYKGHDELLETWPSVTARVPNARLIVVGSGDDQCRLQQKAENLGLGGSVVFTGFASPESLASWYRKASVFAMPSRNEGFGLVYLEAMAHRLPCIGSIHDAAGEVIDDGTTGFLVDQSDRQGLTGRLVQLLADEGLREEMGRAGESRLRSMFPYAAFRDRLVEICEGAFGAGLPGALRTQPAGRAVASR